MALILYQQEDTNGTFDVGCSSRSAGLTTGCDQANAGGSAGSSATTVDPDNLGSLLACYDYQCGKPGAAASWDLGDWVVRINFSAGDAGTTLEEIHICDWLSGTGFTTIRSDTGAARGISTTAGQQNITLNQGSAHSPQSAADSQPFIVLVLSNADPHGGSSVAITPSLIIDTPIDDGAAGGSAHYYNKLLGYRAA